MMTTWHLDMVRDGYGAPLLVVIDPHSGLLEREPMRHFVRLDVIRALRNVVKRTVHDWPAEIVTDNARQWFGVADAIGARHRILVPGQMTELERIARGLIAKLGPEE